MAQSQTQTTSPSSQITSAASTSDIPLSLWAIADSLLSSYYPSTTLSGVASLTWPASVVIGSSTYVVHTEPTGTPNNTLSLNKPKETDNAVSSSSPRTDRSLGIGLGVGLGLLAVIVGAVIVLCLRRRQKKHGGRGIFQREPSVSDSEVGHWRAPEMDMMNTPAVSRPPRGWQDDFQRMPPRAMHPAFAGHHTSSTTISDDNPFYTPAERAEADAMLTHAELPATAAAGAYRHSNSPHTSTSYTPPRETRPATPFSPAMMMMGSTKHPRRSEENPFASPQDDEQDRLAEREATHRALVRQQTDAERERYEADDLVSPIIPAKHPERRHSPQIHYPSWSEVSEFDFSSSQDSGNRRSLKEYSSGSTSDGSGWSGWSPGRESAVGRTELA